MLTVVSPSSSSVGNSMRSSSASRCTRSRVAEWPRCGYAECAAWPAVRDGDANRALGADRERALGRLAVDDHATRRRNLLRGERVVRGMCAVVRDLFADDEQTARSGSLRRGVVRRRRSSPRRCPWRRTRRGRGSLPSSTRGAMNGGTVSRCVDSVTSGASTAVAKRSSRPGVTGMRRVRQPRSSEVGVEPGDDVALTAARRVDRHQPDVSTRWDRSAECIAARSTGRSAGATTVLSRRSTASYVCSERIPVALEHRSAV